MTDPQLTNQLQELGLTKYQSQAYIAAVRAGQARPNDLVDMSGVPQGRIYDVIDDLAEMGVIEVRSKGQGKVVTAPPPGAVLEDLKRRRINDVSRRIDQVSADLEGLYDETDAQGEGYVTMVRREETALRHIRRAIEAAECWLVVSVPADIYRRIESEVTQALSDGVTVRLLISGSDDPPNLSFPSALPVRFRSAVDTFVAADRTYGIYASKHPQKEQQPYLITQEATLVLLLQDYTEAIWEASAPIQDGGSFPRRFLDPWRLIVSCRDALTAGDSFVATVRGHETETRAEGVWTGKIVDYELSGPVEADYHVAPPTIASITLDTGTETATVGGWRATIEDIAATSIKLERA
ncbi:MAG: TrmB family transcriptional regulator [Halolamina sp.]